MAENYTLKSIIESAVADALELVPENVSRGWRLDYLFKYKFGDRLPRGPKFDKLRLVENKKEWAVFRSDILSKRSKFTHCDKVSPFLEDQLALLALITIHGLAIFKVAATFDAISLVEDGRCAGSSALAKYNVKFNKKGSLRDYVHHHVGLLPNSYGKMLGKKNNSGMHINLEDIVNNISLAEDEFSVDFSSLDSTICQRRSDRSGRLTGHWLISKTIDGKNIYLGIFPHGHGSYDDLWIRDRLIASERAFLRVRDNS